MQFGRLAIVSSTEPLLDVSEIYKSGILLTPALRLNSYYGNYKTEYGKEKSSLNSEKHGRTLMYFGTPKPMKHSHLHFRIHKITIIFFINTLLLLKKKKQYMVSAAKIPSVEYTMNLLISFAYNDSDSKPEL